MGPLKFRKALTTDESDVVSLVNSVYRSTGARQWTSEVGMVVGPRLTEEGFQTLLTLPNTYVLLGCLDDLVLACVQLEKKGASCYLGMLSVAATYQQYGFGKQLLVHCEEFAKNKLNCSQIHMHVISVRTELLDWYLRKGYQSTEEFIPFYSTNNKETGEKLFFQVLRKSL